MSNVHALDIQSKEDIMYPFIYLSYIKFRKFLLLFFCVYDIFIYYPYIFL